MLVVEVVRMLSQGELGVEEMEDLRALRGQMDSAGVVEEDNLQEVRLAAPAVLALP